ncbi:TRAP-like protein, putative [Plasmodium chabaudi chabaudi]|uniref:TRAP-like protein, putative n=1 Tax=Plasmodium chabaudi chabaudi TaxID=31271 RepID=A0A1C6YJP9_PLACU|nr:TRAP-like protein, putative [Plasmodium chabaudi chabaudi]
MKYTSWRTIYCIIYFLLAYSFCENKSLIDDVTRRGDLDLVILLDIGNDKIGNTNNLGSLSSNTKRFKGILNNIVELSSKLLSEDTNRNVKISFITYDSLYVQTKGILTNNARNGVLGNREDASVQNESAPKELAQEDGTLSTNASITSKEPTIKLEQFIKAVLKTKIDETNDSIVESNHLKALNYVGLKHYYNSNENTTKLIIMFINTDGNTFDEETDLDIINNLFDKKNITLNIVTKIQYLSYCHYINSLGPNTNELLRCIIKNSYYNKHMLSNSLVKIYKDIPVDAVCSDWDDWSACTTTCDVGVTYRRRTTITNIKNPINGLYKRKGKNCSQKKNYIINECFYKSCDNSLDVCDQEMDISLLVDDSSIIYSQSIWLKYFITPIRKMVSQFNMNNNLINISISSFSNKVYNWFDFTSPLASNRNKLLSFLTSWRYNLGGPTKDIIGALNFINNNNILNSNINRQNVKKVLIIINTGDIHDNNYNEIIQKISNNYNLDIYSICLKNKNTQNCSALSIDSNYILGNQKKKFFYSFEDMGGFNENLSLIQKNICSNSSHIKDPIHKEEDELETVQDPVVEEDELETAQDPVVEEDELEAVQDPVVEEDELETAQDPVVESDELETVQDQVVEEDELETAPDPVVEKDELETAQDPVVEEDELEAVQDQAVESDELETAPDTVVKKDKLKTAPDTIKWKAKPRHTPFKRNRMNKRLIKNKVILKSVNNLDKIGKDDDIGDDSLGSPLKKYKSDSFINSAGKNDNKKKPMHSFIKKLLKIFHRQKKRYSIKKINLKDKNKLDTFIQNLQHDLNNNNDESSPKMFEQIEGDFNNLLADILHKSINNPNTDLNEEGEESTSSTYNINDQPSLNDEIESSYSNLFDSIDTEPYWKSEINLKNYFHSTDNDDLDKVKKSENLVLPPLANPINNSTGNDANAGRNSEISDEDKEKPVTSDILESEECEQKDNINILPCPQKLVFGAKKNPKYISKYDIIKKFRSNGNMKIDSISFDLDKGTQVEQAENDENYENDENDGGGKNAEDKPVIGYEQNNPKEGNTNYEQKMDEKIESLEDIVKTNNNFIENEKQERILYELTSKGEDWKDKHLEWDIDMNKVWRNNKGIESYIEHDHDDKNNQKTNHGYVYKYAASFFITIVLLLAISAYYTSYKQTQITPISIPEEFIVREPPKTEDYEDQTIAINYNNSAWQ